MSFPRDAYPYTNFHELNLGYFIVHFREIFSQWADLYDQMIDWKDSTDEELETWKTGVEADLDQREAALRAELETWKAQTGQDIAGWEDATLAALTAWQTATQAVFEAIRVEAAGSATAAAASAEDAATAKTAAETAQAAAEAAAASVQASAAQISTNTGDIADLKTQLLKQITIDNWIRGNVTAGNGKLNTNDGDNIRNIDKISIKDGYLKITATNGCQIIAYAWENGTYIGGYHADGTFSKTTGSAQLTEFTFTSYPNYEFIFVVRKEDGTRVEDSDSEYIVITTNALGPDKTLTKSGEAADAKATGDSINNVQNNVDNLSEIVLREIETLPNEIITPTFEVGSVSINSGNVSPDNLTRIHSPMLLCKNRIDVTIAEGMKANAFLYEKNGNSYVYKKPLLSVMAENQLTVLPEYPYARIVYGYTDDSDILPAAAEDCVITRYKLTDTSLSVSGVSADAKATGDKIDNAVNDIQRHSDFNNSITKNSYTAQSLGYLSWHQGNISSSGENDNTNYSQRIRTLYWKTEYGIRVNVPEGYGINVYYYDDTNVESFVERVYDEWQTGEVLIFPDHPICRLTMRKTDNSNIAPSVSQLLEITRYSANDDIPKPNVSTGNLLGNVTIRAGKKINFNDGTSTYIEWYLLQDPANNFYFSKDLNSKIKLFTFNAPSGYTKDWSCGIDAYNNVFFFRDAASYTGVTRLDDANRVNPVYFLASEDYQEMHTLDFGDSLKPAGWLGDTGWCVLPNKDIVMGEYTRGTLKTCNIWHIDSTDITDPDNWTVTWSHDIIDTDDTTTPGMKHIHCVQYDPYTGLDNGIVYFGTGDSETGSFIFHSFDNGLNWTPTYEGDHMKRKLRVVSMAFTEDKVYYASDSYQEGERCLSIIDRDANGVIDIAGCTEIDLPVINRQACYGCVYVKELNLIVMMDRSDWTEVKPLVLKAYDITDEEIKTIATLQPANNTAHIGFRTKFVDWYPNGNAITIGFNPSPTRIAPDVNVIAALGNQGGTDGTGTTRINNLIMHLYKDSNGDLSLKFSTIYI